MADSRLYATVADYRATTATQGADADVEDALQAASRLIERELGDHPRDRVFLPDAAASARTFDSLGEPVIWIDDCGSVTSIEVDTEGAGTFGAAVMLPAAPWILPLAESRDPTCDPIHALEIIPTADAPYRCWPYGRRRVRVTAVWGWPAVPLPIKRLTILIARQDVDLQIAGATQVFATLDEGALQMAPGFPSLVSRIKRDYSRRTRMVGAL